MRKKLRLKFKILALLFVKKDYANSNRKPNSIALASQSFAYCMGIQSYIRYDITLLMLIYTLVIALLNNVNYIRLL